MFVLQLLAYSNDLLQMQHFAFLCETTISYPLTTFDISSVFLCTRLTGARWQICWGRLLFGNLTLCKQRSTYLCLTYKRTLIALLIKTNGGGVFLICSAGWMSFDLTKIEIKPFLRYLMALISTNSYSKKVKLFLSFYSYKFFLCSSFFNLFSFSFVFDVMWFVGIHLRLVLVFSMNIWFWNNRYCKILFWWRITMLANI